MNKTRINFLKPLGTRFFQPRGAKMRAGLPFWSRPGGMCSLRRGFGRGKPEIDVRNLALEGSGRDKKTWTQKSSTPSPLGGGSLRAFRRAVPVD